MPKPERVAVLVIHGIGQQRPYETLDHFTRNLMGCFGTKSGGPWEVTAEFDRASDPTHLDQAWIRASLMIKPSAGPGPEFASDPPATKPASMQDMSLFEYYWAPITQGKVTYRGSLWFLIRAGLTPFFQLMSNVGAISRGSGLSVGHVVVREIWRLVCLFLPLLLLLAWLLYWLSATNPVEYFRDFKANAPRVVALVLMATRYLFLYTCLRALLQGRKKNTETRYSPGLQGTLFVGLLCILFLWPISVAPFANSVAFIGSWMAHGAPWLHLFGHASTALRSFAIPVCFPFVEGPFHTLFGRRVAWFFFLDPDLSSYFKPMIALLIAYWIRSILIKIVGDLAVYCNADTFASSYAARSQILEECSATLSAILLQKNPDGTPKFDRVFIAAHSLGSVIAYDTMNQIRNVARTAVTPGNATVVSGVPTSIQPSDLTRLRGLVTFGCPLNKIY